MGSDTKYFALETKIIVLIQLPKNVGYQ